MAALVNLHINSSILLLLCSRPTHLADVPWLPEDVVGQPAAGQQPPEHLGHPPAQHAARAGGGQREEVKAKRERDRERGEERTAEPVVEVEKCQSFRKGGKVNKLGKVHSTVVRGVASAYCRECDSEE